MSHPNDLPESVSDKLDRIAEYLHSMNRREKMRTVGSIFRSIILLVPFLFFVGMSYYVYTSGDQFVDMLVEKVDNRMRSNASNAVNSVIEGVNPDELRGALDQFFQ